MRTPRFPVLVLSLALLAGCAREAPPTTQRDDGPTTASPPAGPPREVFRLQPDGVGGLAVAGVVPTQEARALLVAEIRRRWRGLPVSGDLVVESDAPALWVPEAMALMPYAAGVQRGGLIVRAEPGPGGGGVLSITGRVADDAALARLAADAGASVAPPFVVETALDVGLAADSSDVAMEVERQTAVLTDGVGADAAAADARSALAGSSIAFRPGTAHLDAGSLELVARLATSFAAHPDIAIVVSAAGEGSGSSSLDRALAARRARAVVEALAEHGIEPGRLSAADEPSAVASVTFRLSGAASE